MCKLGVRCCFALCVVGLVAASADAQTQSPRVYLEIVGHNAVCVGGTSAGDPCARDCDCPGGACVGTPADPYNLTGEAGDEFIIEAYATEWSPSGDPERLRAYQVVMDSDVLASGNRGELEVLTGFRCCNSSRLGFDPNIDCSDLPSPNPPLPPVVCAGAGFCTTTSERAAGAFISQWRLDYAMLGQAGFAATDLSASDLVRYTTALFNPGDALPFPNGGAPKYLATIVVRASDNACGVFEVNPGPWPATQLQDQDSGQIVDPLTGELGIQGVRINLGACECQSILASDPANCSIDARQPSTPTGTNQTTDTIIATLDCGPREAQTAIANGTFIVTEVEADGSPPVIASVAWGGAGTSDAVVRLTAPLAEGKWTCLQFDPDGVLPPSERRCFGVLPGDANADSYTEAADVTSLIECLDADPSEPCDFVLTQCDTDRSGLCTPADLLRLIDLMTGGGAFDPYQDMGILDGSLNPIACPSPTTD